MRRHAPLLVVLALLVGSAAAFAVAEHLKLEKSPVAAPDVDKVFSPVCRCPQAVARIAFRLRKNDRLTVSLLDASGQEIRRLADHVPARRGRKTFFWNGRDDDGRLAPEGSYRPKVELGNADRTIVLPNPIRVDVTAPKVSIQSVRPRVISPDGDGRRDVARVRYHANERVQAILLVDGVAKVRSRSRRAVGQLEWRALGLRPGTYRLAVRAQDLAGNISRPAPGGNVRVRYLELTPERLLVAAQEAVRVVAGTDARRRPLASTARLECRRPWLGPADDPFPRSAGTGSLHPRRDGGHTRRARDGRRPQDTVTTPLPLRPRRAPLWHDASPRDARPALEARGAGRVVLHPSTRRPPSRVGRPRGVRRRPSPDRDVARVGRRRRCRGGAARARHGAGRCDRSRLSHVRGGTGQGALGRQDADVHGASRHDRPAVPPSGLRPPHPRRARRGCLVPRTAGRRRHGDVGTPE